MLLHDIQSNGGDIIIVVGGGGGGGSNVFGALVIAVVVVAVVAAHVHKKTSPKGANLQVNECNELFMLAKSERFLTE